MIFRIARICSLLLLTTGCSSLPSMNSLFQFGPADDAAGAELPADAAPPPVIVAPASGHAEWCQRIGANARAQSAADGFDAATQDRMARQAQSQCAAMATQG
jgi:hypothetical protein